MCGIAGILYNNENSSGQGLIRRMTDALAHRGPDADGYLVEGGISMGHRRLSIIDLSTAANQPFTDSGGRYTMVFNGEIYNYQQIRGLLSDYSFRTSSDTEVLIAAYSRWGAECLRYLRGMFVFAVWDRHERSLFLARDPLGVKPLYYHANKDHLLFASEIRSILATGLVKRSHNPAALLEYFNYQSVSYPLSAISGIEQLQAGSWIKIRDGKTEKKRYWDVSKTAVDFDFGDTARVQPRIRELLLQSVDRRLVSDVPVGAFLSGGIDSSVIVGLMAEAGNRRPNTFNISFQEKEYDESHFAEIVAGKFNTNHTRILLKPSIFLDELQHALDAMDTPSGDGINTYIVSKAIRQHGMTVALSGIGGDELFAGYPFFNQYLALQKRKNWWKIPAVLRRLGAAALPGPGNGRRERMRQILRAESCSIENVYPVFRQILSPQLIRDLTYLDDGGGYKTAVEMELTERRPALASLPYLSQVSVAEYLGYTQHTLLKDTDQMSMAAALEVREPFFDQDLVEFILAVPDLLKKPVYPKSLLVESVKPLLPEEIVFRKKQGFLFPWNEWLKKELRSFCEVHIKNMSQRPFIRGTGLMAYWNRFLKGDKNTRWSEIWLFVVLEYWMEKNGVE